MINITKKGKVIIKNTLTETKNISQSNKELAIKLEPKDINQPKIVSDGKKYDLKRLMTYLKKTKEKNIKRILKLTIKFYPTIKHI